MINALSESIVNLKADSSVENKKNFVSKLIPASKPSAVNLFILTSSSKY